MNEYLHTFKATRIKLNFIIFIEFAYFLYFTKEYHKIIYLRSVQESS